jgi:PAS domain S-box-containing protein
VAAAIADAIAQRGEYDATFRTWTAHGDGLRWVRGIGRVTGDADGRPRRFDGITLDVTAQKRLEHVLRERESWFRELADDVPVALWLSDPTHGCTYVSRRWCEYTGTTLASNLGEGWLAHVHPDDRRHIGAAFAEATITHKPFALDYRLRRYDGTYRWMADLGRPRIGETGEHAGFVGCAIDVHDRKLAEQALLDDDRRKDEYLAMLAHELRNPLAPMRTAVHLLGHDRVSPEATRRALPMLQRQLLHLVRLVDDLLDVTRIRTGKLALRRAPTVVQEVVRLAIEASGIEAPGAPSLAVSLPPVDVVVDGDSTRLVQAVVNLLNNAAKFTSRDGHVSLDVVVDDGAREVTITVRDTGVGMDAALLPRVFDLFVQAGAPRDQARSGLGIGLTLVRSLVEMHGGRVAAASDGLGKGSAVTIVLPLQPVIASAPAI